MLKFLIFSSYFVLTFLLLSCSLPNNMSGSTSIQSEDYDVKRYIQDSTIFEVLTYYKDGQLKAISRVPTAINKSHLHQVIEFHYNGSIKKIYSNSRLDTVQMDGYEQFVEHPNILYFDSITGDILRDTL